MPNFRVTSTCLLLALFPCCSYSNPIEIPVSPSPTQASSFGSEQKSGRLSTTGRLNPKLLWELRRVSDPQVDPSGQLLLYSVRSYSLDDNAGVTQLHLLDMASGDRRQLTHEGSNWSGRWSPDGTRIAFLSTRGDSPQIYSLTVKAVGEVERITNHPGGVANMAWSPKGTHFSFTAEVKLDADVRDRYPDLPKARAAIFDSLMIRHWDQWREGSYSHLFVVSADGGPARDLMPGERYDTPVKPFGGGEQITWSPDGKELCYTAKKESGVRWTRSTNNDLWVVSIDGGPARNMTQGMMGYDQDPAYSPDGRFVAFHSMERGGFESDRNRIMVQDRETGQTTEVTEDFDQSAHSVIWSPDSNHLYFDSDTQGTTQIYSVPRSGGVPEPLTEGRYQFRGAVASQDGEHLYCLRQRMERPYEIVRLETSKRSTGELLTDENGEIYSSLQLPSVIERKFPASDGKDIHAWVIYPPNFDPTRKWPMLLYCQGGPQSQVGQWFSYRWNFHLMAAQGYIVLAVNRRGLPGFGQEWNDQISRDWGGQAMKDLLSATDAMFAEDYVDRERTAAIGASFGGYSVYWLMGHDKEDRFCAMVSHCGVMNLEAMYLSTEELFFVDWDLGGAFWSSPELAREYERFSPHRFVGKWDTPLLVVHGQKDFRVPVTQGIQAFQAAQLRGVPSRFLYFPDEGHWVLSPQNGVLWHRVFFDWLDHWCKPERKEPEPPAAVRKHFLERVDDTAVVQLYADGFELLSLRDKILCYHLSHAAIAGRDIFIDQKFAQSLQIRDLMEELYLHRSAMDAQVAKEIDRYIKLFWVHNGIHNAHSTEKELLALSKEQFQACLEAARKAGATLPDSAQAMAAFGIMSDPNVFISCTNKNPGEGKDPVSESCNNFYVGVSSEDLDGFEEKNPLNGRVVKSADGSISEQIYRAGDGESIPPGLYARELNEVIRHLEYAIPYAPEKTAACLRLLIRYYRTGEVADWRAFNIAWVADSDSIVDQINGFVEVYVDARGQKGAWEAVVSFLNKDKTGAIESIAKEAQWFEDRMPWDEEFKKENVKGITARAISVITETGDSGPVTPIGINLPNEADIRQDYGSKSVNLSNVVEGYNVTGKGGSLVEFASSPEEIERARKWGQLADDTHTNLHEVVGHASGRIREEVKNPAQILGTYYSTLEEGRADLVGLYWIPDAKLQEMKIVPHPDAALALYESYARNALVQLRRISLGKKVEEDHMRNRQMVVHWLIDNSDAVAVNRRDGKTYYQVTSVEKFRAACGRLLSEIMRIKATGDFKAGKALVDDYGTFVDRKLHQEVLARMEKLDLPSITGFVQPELRLVHGRNGEILDVEVHYPQDLAAQMLRWSGRQR